MTADNIYPSPEKKSRFFYGYTVAGAALIIMLLSYGVRTSFGVFFKPMEAEFGWTRALISGTVTLSLIVQGLWGIYMGRINDRFGSRRVITLSTLLLALGLLLIATTCFSWQLYLFYGVLIGLGMGGFFVALMSTISRWFIKRRGLMTGIVMAGIGVGTLAIAPLSTWLISLYGWRTANVIIGLIVLFADWPPPGSSGAIPPRWG